MKESDGSPSQADGTAEASRGSDERTGLGAALAGAGCLGLLGAAAGLAYAFFEYMAALRLIGGERRPQYFRGLWGGIEYHAPTFAWAAAAAGGWLAILAMAEMIIEHAAPPGQPAGQRGLPSTAELRSRRASAVLASILFCAIGVAAHLILEGERKWAQWATMATVALAGPFAGLRAYIGALPPRLPRALLPVTLAASSFLFGTTDVLLRWSLMGSILDYEMTRPLVPSSLRLLRANLPNGTLALLGPALVLLTFAVWRWAEGPTPSPGARSRAPYVLAAAAGLFAISCAGLDRHVRADIRAFTGGSGSNEDIVLYVQGAHPAVLDPPSWLWTDP